MNEQTTFKVGDTFYEWLGRYRRNDGKQPYILNTIVMVTPDYIFYVHEGGNWQQNLYYNTDLRCLRIEDAIKLDKAANEYREEESQYYKELEKKKEEKEQSSKWWNFIK